MSSLSEYANLPIHEIDLAGTPLHYRRVGNGPPLLLIHGWPLCGATYREYVARMHGHWSCIVPDLPGAGATPWEPRTRNMLVDWGELMAQLADALELERFGVLAHDSGATMARVMAARLGDRVAAMVLCNTEISNHGSPLLEAMQRALQLPGSHRLLSRLMQSRRFLRSNLGLRGCFDDLAFIEGEFAEACLAPLVRDARGARLSFLHADLRATRELPRIHREMTAPCLLVWGEDDRFFPLDRARGMLPELPAGSALEVVPRGRLFVHEEKVDEVLSLAEPFLAKHLL